jgi:hypothetical protein
MKMWAVLTVGNGGYDKMEYTEVDVRPPLGRFVMPRRSSPNTAQVPQLAPDEVLVNVLAAGVNNTDINLRLGWRVDCDCSPAASLASRSHRPAESQRCTILIGPQVLQIHHDWDER